MERVQRTIDELEDDAAVVRGEMDGTADEPDPGAVAMGAAGTTLATLPRRRRLEREAAEYAAEIASRTEELERLDAEVARARRELIDAEHDVVFVDDHAQPWRRGRRPRSFETRLASRTSRGRTRRRCVGTRRRVTRRTPGNGRGGRWWRSGNGSWSRPVARVAREAYKRVNEKLQFVREHLEAAASMDRERHVDDTRRLLELKHSTERAFEQVAKYVAAKNSFHEQRKADRRARGCGFARQGAEPVLGVPGEGGGAAGARRRAA